jgi:hypothetical protein
MSPSMSTFSSFMNATGPSFLTGPEDVVNEAVKQTYILGRFLRGADMAATLQGGSDIRDSLMFDEQTTAQWYSPNATFTPTNPQVLVNWKAYWRFKADHMSWTDQEIELQVPEGMTATARHQIYKRIKHLKEQRLWTSLLNSMENDLWRVPEAADMEAETGQVAYSLPAFLNDFTNGLFYSGATPTGKTAWTVKQNINPATETRWKSQLALLPADSLEPASTNLFYDSSTPTEADSGDRNIIQTFDYAWMLTNFQAPPTKQEYFENNTLYKQFIACSFRGQGIYMDLLRASQDTYVTSGRQDPAFTNPSYAGIDVVRVAALNQALLYPAETLTDPLVSEMPGTSVGEASGPRFYWINGNYIRPIFHSRRYMVKGPVKDHRDQPFTKVQYVDVWMNVVARSLQRHALVSPVHEPYLG